MCPPKPLNINDIISSLDTLRMSTNDKNKVDFFTTAVEVAWKKLRLTGDPDSNLLENMLIDTIKGLYNKRSESVESVNGDARRKEAKKHDISLLMFGLLDGYYHTKLDSGTKICISSKMRYDQYLGTNIFTDLEYPGEGTYEEIKAKDKRAGRKQPRPLNAIMSIAKECKGEISKALLELISSGAYLKCSRAATFDEKTGQRTDLPKPRYTKAKFRPKGDGASNAHRLLSRVNKKISLVAILAISAFGGFLLLARIILGNLSKDIPINNIYIVNDQISLLPGEREKLMVAIYPNDANIELLEYVSDNANVAYIERSDKDRYVVALDDWQADAVHQATITVQYEEATDTASVTVQEPTLTSLETQTGIGENQSTDGSGEK